MFGSESAGNICLEGRSWALDQRLVLKEKKSQKTDLNIKHSDELLSSLKTWPGWWEIPRQDSEQMSAYLSRGHAHPRVPALALLLAGIHKPQDFELVYYLCLECFLNRFFTVKYKPGHEGRASSGCAASVCGLSAPLGWLSMLTEHFSNEYDNNEGLSH